MTGSAEGPDGIAHRIVDPGALSPQERYHLVTSLVVPRPIGWASTWGPGGVPNLAPFSFFQAISGTPPLVCLSIGRRAGAPKDTLANVRERRALCVNVVSEDLLESMNLSSAEVGPEVDEFQLAGLALACSERVDAPFVRDCRAVLECELREEVALEGSAYTLIVAEIVGVRLAETVAFHEGSHRVRVDTLRPVGRLSGPEYTLLGEVRVLPRP
ncbi:MAG TPA: flavin reductase family protein [Longimicrobiales bacterium]|nr:flavin reductase family protein [Longimicrobiales bacterium]